jgi:hypothetical protein
MMQAFDTVTIDELVALPPTIFGIIRWKNISVDFLQILHAISVMGKNTKDELEACLKLRNTCGHPNSHRIGEHRVTSHVETLILNVFSNFVI